MNRRELIKICGLFQLGLYLPALTSACGEATTQTKDIGKIIIIGAGAGGLCAGYLLQQQGIEFQILEASSNYGGRMKRTTEFANFPIPLGAEWIHVSTGILEEVVNDNLVEIDIETTRYKPDIDSVLYEGKLYKLSTGDLFRQESKFINSSWFDFFEEYIVPSIEKYITYNAVVEAIDYSTEIIEIVTLDQKYSANQVILTAPVKILQNDGITFTPKLPKKKRDAIKNVTVWDGCKAFIEFSKQFYPAVVAFNITPAKSGQKLYYNASYGQNTSQNILGLFAVGSATLPYLKLSDDELINYMLNELDELFDGEASPHYVKHIFQNWNAEPYAKGAYVCDHENWRRVRTLGESVANRLFFAGTAYTDGEDWSSVHTAARSASKTFKEILDNLSSV